MKDMPVRDVIIVGGGPSGLSAAIAAKQRGLDYVVLEKGTLVDSIYRFPPQMVFFTTPELLEIGGLPFVSPYDKPTRAEALRYYRRVVDAFDLQIAFDERVEAIEREGDEGDAVFALATSSKLGKRVRHARHIVLATGYYDHPNCIGVPGEGLPHVRHYYHEPHEHYRQRVVVVGGGNSAAEAALELHRAGARVTLVHRGPHLKPTIKYWVRPDIENRIKEGSIAARFRACVTEIRPSAVVIAPNREHDPAAERAQIERETAADRDAATRSSPAAPSATSLPNASVGAASEDISADAVYLLTGYRADTDLMCRAGIALTDREAPVHDPATFETNVPNLFVAGGAIAGVDTGTVFIENGRFHGEKIIEEIARRAKG